MRLRAAAAQMLTPLVTSGQPHMCDWLVGPGMVGLMEWYGVISKYKDAVWSWMQKHDKHIRVSVSLSGARSHAAASPEARFSRRAGRWKERLSGSLLRGPGRACAMCQAVATAG